MRAVIRIAQLLLLALAVHAAGAERVHARAVVVLAAADVVASSESASQAVAMAPATLEATDGAAPLPFLGADQGPTGDGLEMSVRAVRLPREGTRADARPSESLRDSGAMTRARALALAYLDYSLALLQRRAGIPVNHTTAPPSNNC